MPGLLGSCRELTLAEIAELTRAELVGGEQPGRRIRNIAPLDTASACDISFLDHPKHLGEFADTRAGACLTAPRFAAAAPVALAVLVTKEPYRAFVTVARALFADELRPSSLFGETGRSAGARVHVTARIESSVVVDPQALIGPRAQIGAGTVIGPGAVIGPDVCVGRGCAVGAGATILHTLIGDRVIIHPGARIGQDGFDYLPGPEAHQKIPQTGRVIIQDDVEIGANSTIDRGAMRDTVIGEGTKIDNLVQIAHNVAIGRHCLIASQTGISASVQVGDFVRMGGQVNIADEVTVGAGAVLAARSAIGLDIPARARRGRASAQPAGGRAKGPSRLRRPGRRGGKSERGMR
jgi:UDP-3-O-[3-hydroxymyristoyl] glucosamine N-acyltransferase